MTDPETYYIEKKNPRLSAFRVLAVSRRVLRQITRDRRTFAMIIIMPLVIMFIFGVALSGEVKHTSILIDNQDTTVTTPFGSIHAAKDIIANLTHDDRVDVHTGTYTNGIDGVEQKMGFDLGLKQFEVGFRSFFLAGQAFDLFFLNPDF